MSLLQNPAAQLWREQFETKDDFELAGKILKKFIFISAARFKRDMEKHLELSIPSGSKAAFFIERELKLVRPNWRYKQTKGYKVKNKFTGRVAEKMYPEKSYARGQGRPPRWRADGSALPAVKSPKNLMQEIGSEGVVATIVSKFCNKSQSEYAMHPHTTHLRKMKVQYLVVVTDFIGSGTRTLEMLDSLWRVASIRSWKSAGYLEVMVICYSSTENGVRTVLQHPTHPIVKQVRTCPTIYNSFSKREAALVRELCLKFPSGANYPLGYKETGALIAFEHSCPNNVPAMFTDSQKKKASTWLALFPKRTTSETSSGFQEQSQAEQIKNALTTLRLGEICGHSAFIDSSVEQQSVIVFLAAVSRGRRNTSDIINACELTLVELRNAWLSALNQQLITKTGRLTLRGHTLLQSLQMRKNRTQNILNPLKMNYYPSSLRAPKVGS